MVCQGVPNRSKMHLSAGMMFCLSATILASAGDGNRKPQDIPCAGTRKELSTSQKKQGGTNEATLWERHVVTLLMALDLPSPGGSFRALLSQRRSLKHLKIDQASSNRLTLTTLAMRSASSSFA
jgi:hypothetical protein